MKIIVLFFYLFITIPEAQAKKPLSGDAVRKVLFIGNSLTYYNDLPQQVVRIAKEKGVKLKADMIAYPDYALEDHWNDGKIQRFIEDSSYDFVVIQQGPSSQSEGRAMLLDYGARIKALCEKKRTQLVFYMVWPALVNIHTFDAVIKNYREAAAAMGALLSPVGEAWKKRTDANDLSWYGPDFFHPSKKGTEQAAGIICQTLIR